MILVLTTLLSCLSTSPLDIRRDLWTALFVHRGRLRFRVDTILAVDRGTLTFWQERCFKALKLLKLALFISQSDLCRLLLLQVLERDHCDILHIAVSFGLLGEVHRRDDHLLILLKWWRLRNAAVGVFVFKDARDLL